MNLHINICSSLSSPSVRGDSFRSSENQVQDRRALANKCGEQDHEHRAEQIGVPGQVHGIMSRLFLMTMLCAAVIAELQMPRRAIGTASKKAPMKKPSVTMEQLSKMRRDGRAEREK